MLGSQRERSEATLVTSFEPALRAILATDHAGEHSARCGFLCASRELRGVTGDRREFYGTRDARTSPRALSRPRLSGRVGGALAPCGAVQVAIDVGENQRAVTHLSLGEA